jgi:DNA-binding response OmpR family regulator
MDLLKGKRILVIDDAEAERMLISTYLQQHGCRLYHAHDGVDGIHKAKLLLPDLILMDVDMPRCDGYAACKALSGDPTTADVPVIFLSAFAGAEQRVQGLLAGAVDFIGKPFDFDEVRLRLSIHLRNRLIHSPQGLNDLMDSSEEHVETGSNESNLYSVLFHSARVHLLRRLDNAPGIQELARLTGTNSKRLNAAFRHSAGVTVFEYLREERMKEARKLLQNTGLSVSDIAARVGFSSSANFATAFRERYGMTPSAFRQTRIAL